MSPIVLTITDDEESPREIVLSGKARLNNGDTILQVVIPQEYISTDPGRQLVVEAEVNIRESTDDPLANDPVLFWSTLTAGQWVDMSVGQWASMEV